MCAMQDVPASNSAPPNLFLLPLRSPTPQQLPQMTCSIPSTGINYDINQYIKYQEKGIMFRKVGLVTHWEPAFSDRGL
jgi:hypothetical protein